MNPDVVVVGAGPSGLACAARLARDCQVLLVDRIPVPGGESGWQSTDIRQLAHEAEQSGVHFELGATALRWANRRLLLAAPGNIHWISASWLVFAGGVRPETATDLHLAGDRPAGILAATVAAHLLSSGERLWKRTCIIGDGRWGEHLAQQLRPMGTTIHAITRHSESVGWADTWTRIDDAVDVLSVHGHPRVDMVCVNGPRPTRIFCDSVILAGDGRPTRNVDGALSDDSDHVLFVQPLGPRTSVARAAAARELIDSWAGNHLERTQR